MLLKIVKTTVLLVVTATALNASSFNAQAEKDRIALNKYFTAKHKDPLANKYTFFPYSTDKELKIMRKGVTGNDFKDGVYTFDLVGKMSRDDLMEMPPFDENIERGEGYYNKYFKSCFPDPAIVGNYPMFDEKSGKVITLGEKAMECVKKAGLKTGKKGWNLKGGKMADLQAYLAQQTTEAGKKVNIQINSAAAQKAYEHGKKEFYTQRGYLQLSCAECHVQGSAKRVRLEYMSHIEGDFTHFPVYRNGKAKMFTQEGRLGGCNRNMGEAPHKPGSDWSSDVLYFINYMANGMDVNGPDVRR